MEEYNNKYDELARTIKVENISSNVQNQIALRRLKVNDPSFDKIWICNEGWILGNEIDDEFSFCPTNGKELGGMVGIFYWKKHKFTTIAHKFDSSFIMQLWR